MLQTLTLLLHWLVLWLQATVIQFSKLHLLQHGNLPVTLLQVLVQQALVLQVTFGQTQLLVWIDPVQMLASKAPVLVLKRGWAFQPAGAENTV